MGIFGTIFVVLLLIKLFAVHHLSWWLVFSPVIVWVVLAFVSFWSFYSGNIFRGRIFCKWF